MSQAYHLSPPKTPQGFSTFRNDSNLNFSHNSPKIQQQTFNSTNNPFNQSLHYSNIEASQDGHAIYYPNHNHDGIYKCSICLGIREVCPSRRKVSMNSQYNTFGNIFVNSMGQGSGSHHLGNTGQSMNNNEGFRKQFIEAPAQSWQNSRVIEEIHYVPVFHTLLKPQIVNPEAQQPYENKKQRQRQSTGEKMKKKPGLNTPLRMTHQNKIITPRSLRKLAETMLKRTSN